MLLSGHQQGDTQHRGTPWGPHMNFPLHWLLAAAGAQVGTEKPAVPPLGSSMEGHQLSHGDFQTAPVQPLDVIFTLQIYHPLHFLSITHASVLHSLSTKPRAHSTSVSAVPSFHTQICSPTRLDCPAQLQPFTAISPCPEEERPAHELQQAAGLPSCNLLLLQNPSCPSGTQ